MAANLPIPIYNSLNDLYQNIGTTLNNAERWASIADEFTARFGRKPSYIVRAPGRVNLIGEHIDYTLFGVLPAAIERDILIACAPRHDPDSGPGSVVADNLHSKYPHQLFAPAPTPDVAGWHIDIDTTQLRWESYVKAGYYGVLNHYFTSAPSTSSSAPVPVPVDLLVDGTIPAGSGLSSSAAMVVASTLAFLAVNGKLDPHGPTPLITKGALVEIAMENEKRVGVNSGGMDQAASVISVSGAALYVSFFPSLSAHPVPLPTSPTLTRPRAVFICANSLVTSDKVVHARTRYNLRVLETLVAARVLAHRLGVPLAHGERVTLREVVGRVAGVEEPLDEGALKTTLERMGLEVELLRPAHAENDGELGVTLEEMSEWSGLTEVEFRETYLQRVDVEADRFQLYKRAKHVFAEAWRVLEFRDICLRASANTTTAADTDADDPLSPLRMLGALMDASQDSCATLFECSCAELDALTIAARAAGALGSRLTGAGWGGCTVSLVLEADVPSFIARLRTTYPPYRGLDDEALKEVVFATVPGGGACVLKVE